MSCAVSGVFNDSDGEQSEVFGCAPCDVLDNSSCSVNVSGLVDEPLMNDVEKLHCLPSHGANTDIGQLSDVIYAKCDSSPVGKLLVVADDGDFQGPHDWRKRLKPVVSVAPVVPERPGSGRLTAGRDTITNGVDRKLKYVDAKMKYRDTDRITERRVSYDDRLEELKAMRSVKRSSQGAVRSLLKSKDAQGQLNPIDTHGLTVSHARYSRVQRESDFTRQVVKPTSATILRTQVCRKSSFQNNCQSEGGSVIRIDIKKCIEKAQKARLYLLQKTGPNSFLIGGDSPDHKYRVIIGEQKCSCGRGPVCVHVFFVMLRVFQLPETDTRLWSKTLKNYEVEALLNNFIERQKKRKVKRASMALTSTSSEATVDDKSVKTSSLSEQSDDEREKEEEEEEELCSICLLEMVDGESLTVCSSGCQNRLHHHCITVWFEECRQQHKQLHCPLCQSPWKAVGNMVESTSSSSPSHSSIQHMSPSPMNISAPVDVESVPLDPVPADCLELSEKWMPILGEEIVVRLFSRNWSVRELAVRMLGQEAVTVLLRGVGEGRSGLLMSPIRQAEARTTIECCFSILAYMLADPVYRVFVSGLRALRSMLLYTPCRDTEQQMRLQALMKPIVKSLLFKCADSNRRTSQLSIDTLLEMVKGDAGELPVGREIVCPGSLGLGGIDFLIRCIVEIELDETPTSVNWQWLLGRLSMLDRLLEEYSNEFEAVSRVVDSTCLITEPCSNHDRSFTVLRFSALHMSFAHAKVAKMVHRVFYNIAALQAHVGGMAIVEQICALLDDVDPSVCQHMRYRLQKVTRDYSSSVHVSTRATQFGDNNPVMFFVSTQETPSLETLTEGTVVTNTPKHRINVTDVIESSVGAHCVSPDISVNSTSVDATNTVMLSSIAHNKYDTEEGTAAGNGHVQMADACVATSPSLLRHRRRGASRLEDYDIPPDERDRPDRTMWNRFPLTSDMKLSEDSCDLTLTPSSSEDRVSFKKEVATTPHNTPPGSADNSASDNCHCKEEVEIEEAQALVAALERSSLAQDVLPYVPGLSREPSEASVTVNIQDEECCDGSGRQYKEGTHWKRGPVIGTGAFSTCYQARDVQTGTLMAVKQISFCRNLSSEQDRVIESVRSEIQMMAKLSHPNIVRILGATRHGYHFFMFVEWMPGCSVAHLLEKYGAFCENVVINYTQQVLRGLAYLHENGSMHRDLKGANLLVDSTGHRVRIGDFGAAARLTSRDTGLGEFEGQLLGTIAFMAPEVLRGANYGRSCDIWSLGCTMIEMITTKPPWGAHDISNHLALIFKIASADQSPTIPDNLSPPLRDIMLRCLQINPEERPFAKDLLKHPLFTMSWR